MIAILRPDADTLNEWTMVPADGLSAFGKIDEPVDAPDDSNHLRTNQDAKRLRVRFDELPTNFGTLESLVLRASVGADVDIDTESHIFAGLYANAVSKGYIDSGPLGNTKFVLHEWTSPAWTVFPGDVLEVDFFSSLIQSDPPSIALRAYLSAAEIVINYQPLAGVFIPLEDPTATIYTNISGQEVGYSPLSAPGTIYTPVRTT